MRRSRGRKLIGQMLVERGHITDEQLEQALETQKQTTQRLGEILMDLGFIEEEPLYECLAEQLNVAYANLKKLSPDPNVAGLITREMATRYMALPLARGEAGTIQVAMAEPADVIALDDLKMKLQVQVEPMLAPASAIEKAIDRVFSEMGGGGGGGGAEASQAAPAGGGFGKGG